MDNQKKRNEGSKCGFSTTVSRLICPVCLRRLSITSLCDMERHLQARHACDPTITREWQCGVCEPKEMYIDATAVVNHMEVVHGFPFINNITPTPSSLLKKPPATACDFQVKGWKLGELPKNWCSSVICPECGEDVLAKDAQMHMKGHVRLSTKLPCLMCRDEQLENNLELVSWKEVGSSDIGKPMVDFHIQWQPKGKWNKRFSGPTNEPLFQYWRCMQKGNTFSVLCHGISLKCTSWVNLDNLPNHLWSGVE